MTAAPEALRDAAGGLGLPASAGLSFTGIGPADPAVLPAEAVRWAGKRRDGFAAGRLAARDALAAAGCDQAVAPGLGADGLPEWPSGWHGSISHTDSVAAALVGRGVGHGGGAIGLDIEPIMSRATVEQVAPTVLPEPLPPGCALDYPEAVTRVFSAKEALFKALYPSVHRIMGFDAAVVTAIHAAGGGTEIVLTLAEDWGPDWPCGIEVTVRQVLAAGHVVSAVWLDGPS